MDESLYATSSSAQAQLDKGTRLARKSPRGVEVSEVITIVIVTAFIHHLLVRAADIQLSPIYIVYSTGFIVAARYVAQTLLPDWRKRRHQIVLDQMKKTGEVIEVPTMFVKLWHQCCKTLDIPDGEQRTDLRRPEYYTIICEVGKVRPFIQKANETDLARIEDHIEHAMLKALQPVADQLSIELAGEEAKRAFHKRATRTAYQQELDDTLGVQ